MRYANRLSRLEVGAGSRTGAHMQPWRDVHQRADGQKKYLTDAPNVVEGCGTITNPLVVP